MNEPSVDQLEPVIENILRRFRIPADDAQEILDEVMLTMLTKRERIRDPERWMLRSLKNRCLVYWRERRRWIYRVIDSGLLTVLTSDDVAEDEKGTLREELRSLVDGIEPKCRDRLERRYGLDAEWEDEVEPWVPEEPEEGRYLRCVGAMARRFARMGSRDRRVDLNLFTD